MFSARKDIFDRLIDSNRNIIISGDISSGKTSNIIFPLVDRLMSREGNYLFLDSKEEYINKYYGYLKSNDYNIIIINLQEADRSDGFNPLTYPYRLYKSGMADKAVEYLESVANSIFLEKVNDDSFWNLSACDLFIGLSLILFKEANEEEVNINSVNLLLNSNKLRDYAEKLDKNSAIYSCLSGNILASSDMKNSIVSVFRQQLRKIISKDKLNNMLSRTTFSFDDLSRDKNAVFIISRDDNRDINVISSMIIEQMFKIIFDNNLNFKYNMILDNVDIINNVNNLSDMLSSGVSRNIRFVMGTRSLDLFDNKYGEYVNKLSNIISIEDKYVEAMIDNRYEKVRYSMSSYNFPKDTINYPVMKKNDIKIFKLNREIVNEVNRSDNTLANINPFINKQDDNIFSIYEDNRNNYNEKEIEDTDDEKEENNVEDDVVEDTNISKINEKISEIEEMSSSDDYYVDGNVSTTQLLRIIDDKIMKLDEDIDEEDCLDEEEMFSYDIFPSINEVSNELEKKKRIKNRLSHYKDYDKIDEEVDKELENMGLVKVIDGKKYYMNGYKKKRDKLLGEKYNIYRDKNSIFS